MDKKLDGYRRNGLIVGWIEKGWMDGWMDG